MSEISRRTGGLFSSIESPFKVYQSCDLDFETPKSSFRLKKKPFNLNNKIINQQEKNVKSWTHLFMSKHPLQVRAESLNTSTPTVKSPGIKPLAPTKPRRSINKTDLKPKKLVFKDQEDRQVEINQLFPPLRLKFKPRNDDPETNETEKIYNTKQKSRNTDDENIMRTLLQKQPKNDDKENCIDNYYRINNSDQIVNKIWQLNKRSNVITSLTQHKNANPKNALKHFRI